MAVRLIVASLFALLSITAMPAYGQTIWINSAGDWPRSASAEPGECRTNIMVTNPESGEQEPACTLRAAIETVNALNTQGMAPQGIPIAHIRFVPWITLTAGAATLIMPSTPLPIIEYAIHLDGTTHRNFDAEQGHASFIISGALLDDPVSDYGLVFGPGSTGSIVDAITVTNFPAAGIAISANSVTVRRSRLGTSFNGGATAFPNGIGILINGSDNLIGHPPAPPGTLVEGHALFPNVIGGNSQAGIDIVGGQDNRIFGNYIGVNRTGNIALDSGIVGIRVSGSATETQIGSFDLSNPEEPLLAGNVIAGHSLAQIGLQSSDNVVVCNHLSFDLDGASVLGTGINGVLIGNSATGNQVGHSDCPNRVHGAQAGIRIGDSTQVAGDAQVVRGNWISIGTGGQAPETPAFHGIRIESGNDHVLDGNRIGHAAVGVELSGNGTLVEQNRIGTGDNGEAYPLVEAGILVDGQGHVIHHNVIGHTGVGVFFSAGATSNTLTRNRIGVHSNDQPLPTQIAGIRLDGSQNTIGGSTGGSTNIVAFSQGPGIIVDGHDQRIWRNMIGTSATGAAFGNQGFGIDVLASATQTRIGGDPDQVNHIADNGGGIRLNASSQILFNRIGEAPNGFVLPNQGSGIEIGPGFNSSLIEFNRIAHNLSDGIRLDPDAGLQHSLQFNEIYNNQGKGIDLGPGGRDQDPDDADTGPNNLQNFPGFRMRQSGFDSGSQELTAVFEIDSSPDHSLYPIDVQFYLSDPGDEHPQGLAYLGSFLYEESVAQSFVTTSLSVPPEWGVEEGDHFVAIATTADGNTSEFSDPFGMPPELVVGGTIENLYGTITLTNSLYSDTTSISGSGMVPFTMSETLYPGESFNIQIAPGGGPDNRSCQVHNGNGVIGDEDYLNVLVVCDSPEDQLFADRFEPAQAD